MIWIIILFLWFLFLLQGMLNGNGLSRRFTLILSLWGNSGADYKIHALSKFEGKLDADSKIQALFKFVREN